jgi:hypothetical protein
MPYETDERLKSYLDTNQLNREQMCQAVLAIDNRFSDVRPRHPRGGPDGGRDIEAVYRQSQRTYGAIGFVNQANDSAGQKKKIFKKFSSDLASALSTDPRPEVFVFFTNVNLTIRERERLNAEARKSGISYCDIFDRERIRICLDAPDGFSIRFQHLGLSLSDAEQASFFARWGDDIQSLIASGFQRMEKSLDRILFLQEAVRVLSMIRFDFEFDREYPAGEIGHFRVFCHMHLKGIKYDIFGLLFGSSDRSTRMYKGGHSSAFSEPSGIADGISGGQWEEHFRIDEETKSKSEYELVSASSSVGVKKARLISTHYNHDDFIRFRPRLAFKDIDQATIMPMINRSLAQKLNTIHIYANGYKLDEIKREDFRIDETEFDPDIPVEFTSEELSDPWIRIRPSGVGSSFSLAFYTRTPKRLFSSRQIVDRFETKPITLE